MADKFGLCKECGNCNIVQAVIEPGSPDNGQFNVTFWLCKLLNQAPQGVVVCNKYIPKTGK